MKPFATTALLAALALPLTALAQTGDNDNCTNATLYGDYAFQVSGQIVFPNRPAGSQLELREGVAMTRFDGHGGLSQLDFVTANGTPVPGAPDPLTGFHTGESGSYTVYPDCTGTAEIDFASPIGPGRITLMFVLGDHARTMHTVVRALVPPNQEPALPSIRSDGEKVGAMPSAYWLPFDPN